MRIKLIRMLLEVMGSWKLLNDDSRPLFDIMTDDFLCFSIKSCEWSESIFHFIPTKGTTGVCKVCILKKSDFIYRSSLYVKISGFTRSPMLQKTIHYLSLNNSILHERSFIRRTGETTTGLCNGVWTPNFVVFKYEDSVLESLDLSSTTVPTKGRTSRVEKRKTRRSPTDERDTWESSEVGERRKQYEGW